MRNIRSEDYGHRTQGCSMRKTRGHRCLGSRDTERDICIQHDHRNARIPNREIATRKHRETGVRGWIDKRTANEWEIHQPLKQTTSKLVITKSMEIISIGSGSGTN